MGWFTKKDQAEEATEQPNRWSSNIESRSSSTTCRNDPQDDHYLICKTTTNIQTDRNGNIENRQEEKEERVLKDQSSNHVSMVGFKSDQIDDFFGGIDRMFNAFSNIDQFFQNDPFVNIQSNIHQQNNRNQQNHQYHQNQQQHSNYHNRHQDQQQQHFDKDRIYDL